MKAVVTGATGLVGGQVVRALVAAGYDVRAALHRSGPSMSDTQPVEWVRAPLMDPTRLVSALSGADVIVHCAALYAYGREHAAEVERVNVEGTSRVVTAAARAGVGRVVVTSSSVTCGSTPGPVACTESGRLGSGYAPAYFGSKVRQEEVALQTGADLGVEIVIACPTVVLGGPATRLVPSNAIIVRYLLDPTRSTYPGGCNLVSAADVGVGHVVLAEHGLPGERYLLGGDNLSWRGLHSLIADLAGLTGPYAELPTSWAYLASAAAEGWAGLTGGTALATREEALTVGRYHWYSSAKAAALGYRSGPTRFAVANALAWLVVSPHVPRWVREGLRLADEVRAARPLAARPLPSGLDADQ